MGTCPVCEQNLPPNVSQEELFERFKGHVRKTVASAELKKDFESATLKVIEPYLAEFEAIARRLDRSEALIEKIVKLREALFRARRN